MCLQAWVEVAFAASQATRLETLRKAHVAEPIRQQYSEAVGIEGSARAAWVAGLAVCPEASLEVDTYCSIP